MRTISVGQVHQALHSLMQTEEFCNYLETSEETLLIEEQFEGVIEALDEMDDFTIHLADPIPKEVEDEIDAELSDEELEDITNWDEE